MRKLIRYTIGVVILATLIQTSVQPSAQAQTSPKIPITTIVTVLGPKFTDPPEMTKHDIVVFSGKNRLDVLEWVPEQGQKGGLQLAILIDNSANILGVGPALNEIAAFINQQPANTAIGLFYAMNGSVQVAAPFSRDHGAVISALRVPLGRGAGESPSVYLSLSDLIHNRWPPTDGGREVLLIASGVDRLNRGPDSPYVKSAIEDAQKAGVEVHSIYTDGFSFDESQLGQFAQGNLVQLTEGSGGFYLFDGASTPLTFSPYLGKLNVILHHQFRLTFTIEPSPKSKGEFRNITIRTEQHRVELRYSKLIWVPGTEK